MTDHRVYSSPGQCRNCMLRRDVYSCSRLVGGNYRRAPQWRSSSICAECAVGRLTNAHPEQSGTWSTSTLRSIAASLDTDQARAAVASWDAKVEARRASSAAHDERVKPYWDRIAERRQAVDWILTQVGADGIDERTCRILARGIKGGDAGNEKTGVTRHADGTSTWERTMDQQVIDYLTDSRHDHLDAATRDALARGIRAGAHRPDPKDLP